jgi:uncharacterized protein (TIGR02646 family)
LIPVARSSQPSVLSKNSTKWLDKLNQQQLQLQMLENDPNTGEAQIQKVKKCVDNAQKKYSHTQIKSALVDMFYGKCAYCESKITVVTYGAIEHFYPKSVYVNLTFEWKNLLLSCDICNDAGHKGTKFPLDLNGNPLLIDSTDGITNPNTHLEFIWDSVAGLASVYGRDDRGKAVETIFDLNGLKGRKELVAHRSKYVKRLFALLRLAQTGDSEAIALLIESCHPSAEYSAFSLVYIHQHIPQS